MVWFHSGAGKCGDPMRVLHPVSKSSTVVSRGGLVGWLGHDDDGGECHERRKTSGRAKFPQGRTGPADDDDDDGDGGESSVHGGNLAWLGIPRPNRDNATVSTEYSGEECCITVED